MAHAAALVQPVQGLSSMTSGLRCGCSRTNCVSACSGGTLQASWRTQTRRKARQASYEALAAKPNDYRGRKLCDKSNCKSYE